ncbi:MAG: hypothetical protein U5J64_02360 [Halobacteriales archaeon]|nr:hypothetical protein [Halobacteriales archaeon]
MVSILTVVGVAVSVYIVLMTLAMLYLAYTGAKHDYPLNREGAT